VSAGAAATYAEALSRTAPPGPAESDDLYPDDPDEPDGPDEPGGPDPTGGTSGTGAEAEAAGRERDTGVRGAGHSGAPGAVRVDPRFTG
jgi:hypothetical protein